MIFNFNDLSKSAKVGYNALYNVVFSHSTSFNAKNGLNKFTVPLCLNSDNKVSLTEKNFIFFESVLSELKVNGYYNIVLNNGRAVDDVKTDFFTVEIVLSKNAVEVPSDVKNFDFSEIDTSRLLKRDGKAEKAKTAENNAKKAENNAKKAEEQKTAEETSKALEETSKELEETKKELAKKEDQLNKKAIAEFNDDALLSIADCIEFLVKKHCPIPSDFDFASFETDLFKVIQNKWDLKSLEK